MQLLTFMRTFWAQGLKDELESVEVVARETLLETEGALRI